MGQIQRIGGDPQAPINLQIIKALPAQAESIWLPVPLEKLLRQWWAVVRPFSLRGKRDNFSLMPPTAEGLDGSETRQRAPYNNNSLHLPHTH